MVDRAFTAASVLAASGWAALLLGSRWPRMQQTWAGSMVPAVLAVAYAVIFPALYVRAPGGYGSPGELLALIASDPRNVLAVWLHVLAFDLLIGWHIVRRARAISLGPLGRAPFLALTFLFGPIGWLSFEGWRRLRAMKKQHRR